ncbi:MAG: TlpA family protein disulfide reductase [Alphaproteobacteria bacterium]|nr:TlpA family protein disulfide reductase [Alphaproteobacteria bacterium]
MINNQVKVLLGVAALTVAALSLLVYEKPDAVATKPREARRHERIVWAEPETKPPGTRIRDAQGERHRLKDFAGPTLVVNLWATWCAPCVKEMPSLDRLQAAHDEEELRVIAISVDHNGPDVVPDFFDENGIEALEPFYEPSMKIFRDAKAEGLPLTLLIGPDGYEKVRINGEFDWDSSEAKALLGMVRGPATASTQSGN